MLRFTIANNGVKGLKAAEQEGGSILEYLSTSLIISVDGTSFMLSDITMQDITKRVPTDFVPIFTPCI